MTKNCRKMRDTRQNILEVELKRVDGFIFMNVFKLYSF